MRTVAFVALMGCLLSWTAVVSAQDRIPWVTDWREARTIAQQQHRLVLLHFYSDACAPCAKLERDVFPRAEVARAMTTGYVPVKINVDRFPQLRDHYKVSAWPTDVIVTPEGKEIARSVPSPADPNRYIAMLDSARAQYGVGNHLTEQVANRDPVTQQSGLPPSRYGTGGFGGATSSQESTQGYASRNSEFQPQPNGSQAAGSQPSQIRNPYTDQLAQNTAPQPANVTPRYGEAYPPGPSQPSVGQSAPIQNPMTVRDQGTQQNPYADGAMNRYSNPTDPRVATNPNPQPPQNTQPQNSQLQNPQPQNSVAQPAAAEPQFALDGFCPVTLVDQARWEKGDPRWGAVHQGKTYLFTSQQGQQQFLAAPDRFAPILSGYDPVRYAESGQLVAGKREHGVFFGNRIFLFADEVALDRFSKHTDFYMARVRQATATQPQQPAYR